MYIAVRFQPGELRKCFTTYLAYVRFVACMQELVAIEISPTFEDFKAYCASQRRRRHDQQVNDKIPQKPSNDALHRVNRQRYVSS